MALVQKNLITKGLSGTLGGTLVFRKVGNKTVVAVTPSRGKEPTEKQRNQRERFQLAVLYAKGQMADPSARADYEAEARGSGLPNAYNIAVADFFHAPDIVAVDLSAYAGRLNDPIRIKVTDDFRVKAVSVEIRNSEGTLVEEGQALVQGNLSDWVYTATVANLDVSGDKITIRAYDLPGNETMETKTL